MGDVEEATAVFGGVLAVAFGDIEGDGSGGAVELDFDVAEFGGVVEEAGEPGCEGDGELVDVELFVVEVEVGHGSSGISAAVSPSSS